VPGKGIVERPNWRIEGSAGRSGGIPQTDSQGMLQTDYLLITRIRNFVSDAARDSGQFILSIGGAHGTATRAIACLLRDKSTLGAIAEGVGGNAQNFQLLLLVSGLRHSPRSGTVGTKVQLVGAPELLGDTAERWRHARQTFLRNLADWERASATPAHATS